MTLQYDGTFGGFLTLIHALFTEKLKDYRLLRKGDPLQENLFASGANSIRMITTDKEKAHSVLSGMIRKLTRPVVNTVTRAFLSEEPLIEETLCTYIRMANSRGPSIRDNLSHPIVSTVEKTANRVYREYHRYLGLIRFRQLSDKTYYAPFRPDSNILPLMPRHFINRFPRQSWIIHDIQRCSALIYQQGSLETVKILQAPDLKGGEDIFSCQERQFCQLWQKYYKNISIEDRKNSKLRQQFVPIKTWEFLPEMQDNPKDAIVMSEIPYDRHDKSITNGIHPQITDGTARDTLPILSDQIPP